MRLDTVIYIDSHTKKWPNLGIEKQTCLAPKPEFFPHYLSKNRKLVWKPELLFLYISIPRATVLPCHILVFLILSFYNHV